MTFKKKKIPQPTLPLTASNAELLIDGSDGTLRRMTLAFAILGWQLSNIREGFAKLLNVSPFQYVALQAIARMNKDEPWTTRLVSSHFRVTTAYVSMELRPLIAKGYLSAEASATDKRLKILALTEQGAELLTRLAPVQQKVNDTLYRQFTSQGLVAQCETIEEMIGSAEQANHYLESLTEGGALGQLAPSRKPRKKA